MDFADPLCALYSIFIIQFYLRKSKSRVLFTKVIIPDYDTLLHGLQVGSMSPYYNPTTYR